MKNTLKNICMVSREYDGLAGAGGVKDVCRQLAEALVRHSGCEVRVIMPRYGFMDAGKLGFSQLQLPGHAGTSKADTVFNVDMSYPDSERREPVSIWQNTIEGVTIYLLESARFAEKQGVYTYTEQEEAEQSWQQRGSGHFDYFAMNILLQKGALDLMILLDLHPDIIHCHDGHAATLPAMMRENGGYRQFFRQTGAVVTIHNAGMGYHQEVTDLDFATTITGLPGSVIYANLLGNSFDPFLAAARYALMNTVSENYARELQETQEDRRTGWLGHRLLKRRIKLVGITNGINLEEYSPDTVTNAEKLGLEAPFNPEKGDLVGKRICKQKMLSSCLKEHKWQNVEQYGYLQQDTTLPLFTFIGRISHQKGVDILLQTIPLLLAETKTKFQMLILGSGDAAQEELLTDLTVQENLAGRICFLKGYDPALANKIYAAGDFFLIPSLYEPCGLTDFISQLLGNLPIVHHVGGLVKVLDGKTGFAFQEFTAAALSKALQQALTLYSDDSEKLKAMQQAAVQRIRTHHSWQHVMKEYLELYRQAL